MTKLVTENWHGKSRHFLTARRRRAALAGGSVFSTAQRFLALPSVFLNRAAVYCSAFGFFFKPR